MNINKKVMGNLTKCYSIAPLKYQGKEHILVAAEKTAACLLFDVDGNPVDTIWDGPGGTMSMVQIPGSDGQFLATQLFYSPNDSKQAKIVVVTPVAKGQWDVKTLVDLPHVHRFDIVERNGVKYLIACALKSGHEFIDDWSMPGKVFAAVLPDDFSSFDEDHQLELTVIKDGLLKNHGYYQVDDQGVATCVISSDNGVFQFIPPANAAGQWEIKQLLDTPASDAVLVDLDEDGVFELAVLSPFHGDQITIYKQVDGSYQEVYRLDRPAEFTHAIYGGPIAGKPALVIGHRKGERNLMLFTFNKDKQQYQMEVIDHDCGPANVYVYEHQGKTIIISTNREIDEIARYEIEA